MSAIFSSSFPVTWLDASTTPIACVADAYYYATGAASVFTLPAGSSGIHGLSVSVKNRTGVACSFVASGGDTIDGAASLVIPINAVQMVTWHDGTGWAAAPGA